MVRKVESPTEQADVRSFVWYPGVLAASLAGGFVGNLSTTLLFAVISETLSYFLSLCFTALLAAVCAVFAGNALAGDGRKGRLWLIVGISEVAGILVTLANLAFMYTVGNGGGFSQFSLGQQMTLSTVVIALVSGMAAWGIRRPLVASGTEAPKDAKSAVLLIVLALLLVISGLMIDGFLSPIA